MVQKIKISFITGGIAMFPFFSFAQDLFSLLDDFMKKAQQAEQMSWMQVSRTYEKGKSEALTTETCYFSKKINGSYMRCDADGGELEIISEGSILLQIDKTSKTVALTKINQDSVWQKTQNSFLQFKDVTKTVSEKKEKKERIFTILPKNEFLTMYDSIIYRWEADHLKKMEIYPAKQFQELIAANDNYSENPSAPQPTYLDIHWEIIYETLEKLPFVAATINDYVVQKSDGNYVLTEKQKLFRLVK